MSRISITVPELTQTAQRLLKGNISGHLAPEASTALNLFLDQNSAELDSLINRVAAAPFSDIVVKIHANGNRILAAIQSDEAFGEYLRVQKVKKGF